MWCDVKVICWFSISIFHSSLSNNIYLMLFLGTGREIREETDKVWFELGEKKGGNEAIIYVKTIISCCAHGNMVSI